MKQSKQRQEIVVQCPSSLIFLPTFKQREIDHRSESARFLSIFETTPVSTVRRYHCLAASLSVAPE